MSPTLLIENGFKFFFYANEHLPRHIHVVKGDDYAYNRPHDVDCPRELYEAI